MCTISLCKKHFATTEVDDSVLVLSENYCSFEFEYEGQSQEIIIMMKSVVFIMMKFTMDHHSLMT